MTRSLYGREGMGSAAEPGRGYLMRWPAKRRIATFAHLFHQGVSAETSSLLVMGMFEVKAKVFSLRDETKERELELIVDTGTSLPVIPRAVAATLDIHAVERRVFTLEDRAQIERDVAWAGISTTGRTCATRALLGDADDVALLGAIVLEALGLEVDPVRMILRPAAQYLLLKAAVRMPQGASS